MVSRRRRLLQASRWRSASVNIRDHVRRVEAILRRVGK